jgi:nucleoside-diphosphate-sugar epimerase
MRIGNREVTIHWYDCGVLRKLVLITGAAGRIGTALRPLLGTHYRLRLVDLRVPSVPAAEHEQVLQADTADLATAERVMHDGVDAVLHLAANPATGATWEEVRRTNIEGTYAVFEAARRQRVPKVVFATTNHVMGFYNLEGAWPVRVDQPIRPDSYYGVSKAFGEALARYYADAFGMSMMCIRIGWFLEQPHVKDALGLWISPRDLAQLVRLCIESDRRFGIYNGESNNSLAQWDLTVSRAELGYAPVDDSAHYAEEVQEAASGYVRPTEGAERTAVQE